MVEVLEFLESIGGAWEQVGEILEILMGIYLLVGGILALVQCFFGYKLLKLWIALIGGVFGGSLALFIGLVQGAGDGALFYFIVGAIIGGFLAFKVYLIGVFFIGVLGGIMTAIILGIMMELGSGIIGLALILGIVGGIAVLILQKPAIIIATSLGAGMQLVGIIGMLLDNIILGILLGGIITCIGMWYQFTSGKVKKPVVSEVASEVAVAVLPVVEEEPKLVESKSVVNVAEKAAQTMNKSIDWQKVDAGLREGMKKMSAIWSQCLVYIKEGSQKLVERTKELHIEVKFKKAQEYVKTYCQKAIEYLSRPHIKKRCLIVGGIIVSSVLIFVIGKTVYTDSLKYRIPSESMLEELAYEKIQGQTPLLEGLSLEKIDKKNRKTYHLSLKGTYIEGSVQMLGHYMIEYIYENDRWQMSIPKLEMAERIGIKDYLSEDVVYNELYETLDRELSQKLEGVTQVTGQDIQMDLDENNYKALYGFNIELTKGVQGYEVKGTIEYSIGESNEWEMVADSLKYELIEKGISQTPNEQHIKQALQNYGVKLQADKETIYYPEKALTIENAKFEKVGNEWYARCQVKVNHTYSSGDFRVDLPYQLESDYLVENIDGPLQVATSNLTSLDEKMQAINKEELINFLKNEPILYLEGEEQQNTIGYYLSEDVKITIGNRTKVDLTGEDGKVILSYTTKLTTNENEVEFFINLPYKQVLDEKLIQYRLATYTNTKVSIYPITEERIAEDLKGRFLDMEAGTKVVQQFAGGGPVEVKIKDKVEDDYSINYTIAAKFQVIEDNIWKEYVGEYKVEYTKDELQYKFNDVYFID